MTGTTRQKISKDTEDLSSIVNQLDLMDIYRTLHRTTAENTFLSRAQGTFFRMDHMLGCKTSLNKCERAEIIQNTFSDHNRTKLEITTEKNLENPQVFEK